MKKPLFHLTMTLTILLSLAVCEQSGALPMDVDFQNFQQNNPAFPKTRREQIDEFSYLFVGGLGNEVARDHYFRFNIRSLHEMGATFAEAYFPSSFRAAGSNLESLRTEIFRLYQQSGKRPVMLFGHSKGGLESLALVLKYPELIREGIVANVTLIQAPIAGNSRIDEGDLFARLLARAFFISPALSSLQTKGINAIIANEISKLSTEDLGLVSGAVRYVVSHKAGEKMKHDFLVAKSDMWIPEFGTILGSLYINHFEVVVGRAVPFIAGNSTYDYVRAFTQSMIVNLMKSRNRRNLEYRFLTEQQMVERFGALKCADLFYQAN